MDVNDRPRRWLALAAAAVATTALTACGGTTAATQAAGPSGEPINLMWIGALSGPGNRAGSVLAGAQAAVQAVNTAGGVKGRPLNLIACDDGSDPNKAAACARKAVTENVVALVAENTSAGESTQPILDQAGIPSIGLIASSAAENKSSLTFPIGSGIAGEAYGSALLFAKVGCKKPAVAYGDYTASKFVATTYLVPVVLAQGLPQPTLVPVPKTAPDLTSYAESLASGGTDCVAYVDSGDRAQLMVKALYASHPDIKFMSSGAVWGPQRLAAVGDASRSLYLTFGFASPDAANAQNQKYGAEMDALGSKEDRNELSRNGWIAAHVTATMLAALPAMTPAAMVDALKASGKQDLDGAAPPWNWQQPADLLPGVRTFGSSAFFARVDDGKVTPLGDSRAFDLLAPATVPDLRS